LIYIIKGNEELLTEPNLLMYKAIR